MALKSYWKLDSDYSDCVWTANMNSTSWVSYVQGIMWGSALFSDNNSYICNSWTNNASTYQTANWQSVFWLTKRTNDWLSSWSNGSEWFYAILWWWSFELIYFCLSDSSWSHIPWWYINVLCADGTNFWTGANFTANWVLSAWKWYHIWFTRNSSKAIQIYIDWVPKWTAGASIQSPWTWSNWSNCHSIGSLRNSEFKDWDWNIDELKHYNQALTWAYIKNDAIYYKWFFS